MKLLVSNLDRAVTEEDVQELFEEFGEVAEVNLRKFPDANANTFSAEVDMPDEFEAEEAVAQLDSAMFDGRMLNVRPGTLDGLAAAEGEAADEDAGPGKNFEPIQRKKPGRDGGPPPTKRRR